MTDTALNRFLAYGTNTQRLAFTPDPPTPASGPSPLYIWYETDTKTWWEYDTQWNTLGTLGGALTLTGLISPTSLSTDQDNYNPTGLASAAIVRLTSSTTVNITGLTAPSAGGQVLLVANIGSNAITLKTEDASSTAANRFDLTADLALSGSAATLLFYDVTSQRWRAAGGAGGGGGGSGTVTSVATTGGITGGTITTSGTVQLASVTAHAVCLGTGSAGALGTATIGTSGNVLTDNGSGNDPSFKAIPSQAGRLIAVRYFTSGSSATYTPTAGTNSVIIELVGGGGGGGGVSAPGSSNATTASGGGGGAWLRVGLAANFSGGTYTVGTHGAGGLTTGTHLGGGGGNTTFTTTAGSPVTYTAGGGQGGQLFGPTTLPLPAGRDPTTPAGGGGTVSGGTPDASMPGGDAKTGIMASVSIGQSSGGGASMYSPGAAATFHAGNVSIAGENAGGYGGGGGGAMAGYPGAAQTGGNGSDGIVIVWEFS